MTLIKDSKIDFSQPDIYTGIIKPNSYTTDQLEALPNPQNGWFAFDSDINQLVSYDGSEWNTLIWNPVDSLVGAGYEFATVADALDAGAQHMAIVGNTTETRQPVVPSGLPNIQIDFYWGWQCAFQLDATNAQSLTLTGTPNNLVTFNLTGAADCIKMTASSELWIRDLEVQNLSVASCVFPTSTFVTQTTRNLTYEINQAGQEYTCGGVNSFCNNLNLTIGSAIVAGFFNINNSAMASQVFCNGDLATGSTLGTVGSNSVVNGLWVDNSQPAGDYVISLYGSLLNASLENGAGGFGNTNISINGVGAVLENVTSVTGGDITFNGHNNATLNNVQGFGRGQNWNISGDDICISNCNLVVPDLQVSGERCRFMNNDLSGAQVAGVQTIDFLAGSKNCIAIGNLVNSAVTDAGTNNTHANNPIAVL